MATLGTFAAGQVLTAAELNAIGTWTTYTPALTAATTNPTLGTGSTAHGVYTKINELVVGNAYFAFGSSGAAAGTGNYSVSLPVAADTTSNNNVIAGHAWIFDSNVTTARHAVLQVVTSTTAYLLLTDNASFVVADNVPFTFTNNDQIRFQFIYKAA